MSNPQNEKALYARSLWGQNEGELSQRKFQKVKEGDGLPWGLEGAGGLDICSWLVPTCPGVAGPGGVWG